MKLSSSRSLNDLRPLLLNPQSAGPDPAYWLFSDMPSRWANLTVIAPGRYGQEYTKTFGHYHSSLGPEIYFVASGRGILILQKKHLENGVWKPETVEEVFLVEAQTGQQIIIPPDYGHSWSNIGQDPLLLFDDWCAGHQPADYEMISKLHGLAYYLTDNNGVVTPVLNPNYQAPAPKRVLAPDFKV